MMHFVLTFSIMRAYGVRLIAIEEVRNYRKVVYIKNFPKMAFGRIHTPHATPLDPPLYGHKLQKSSKESGIFQSLRTINFILAY